MFLGVFIIFFAIIADQFSKFWVDTRLVLDEPIVCNDYFNLIKVWNTGVSFSLFNDYGQTGTVVLIVFALLVSGFLLYWMFHEYQPLKITGLALIIGGAVGNVIDRVRVGAVMDFLDFHYQTYHWPAFNLADTFICIGAFMVVCLEILDTKRKGLNKVL